MTSISWYITLILYMALHVYQLIFRDVIIGTSFIFLVPRKFQKVSGKAKYITIFSRFSFYRKPIAFVSTYSFTWNPFLLNVSRAGVTSVFMMNSGETLLFDSKSEVKVKAYNH
jgi:hypothetical protein